MERYPVDGVPSSALIAGHTNNRAVAIKRPPEESHDENSVNNNSLPNKQPKLDSSSQLRNCAACKEAKPDAAFSKTQRVKGDSARCMQCVNTLRPQPSSNHTNTTTASSDNVESSNQDSAAPSVSELIVEAIRELNGPDGSSLEDIEKFVEEKLPGSLHHGQFLKALNGCVSSSKIDKIESDTYKFYMPIEVTDLIVVAIKELNDPEGSSSVEAIQKFIKEKLSRSFRDAQFLKALKWCVTARKIEKLKNDTFKIYEPMERTAILEAIRELNDPDGSSMEAIQNSVKNKWSRELPEAKFRQAKFRYVLKECIAARKIEAVKDDTYKIYEPIEETDLAKLIVKSVREVSDPNGSSVADIQKFLEGKLPPLLLHAQFLKTLKGCVAARKIDKLKGTCKFYLPIEEPFIAKLIVEAIRELNDPEGSSLKNIQKLVEEKQPRSLRHGQFLKALKGCVSLRKIYTVEDNVFKSYVPLSCSHCHQQKWHENFSEAEQAKGALERICTACIIWEERARSLALPRRKCSNCGVVKAENQFSFGQRIGSRQNSHGVTVAEGRIAQYQQKCLECYPLEVEQSENWRLQREQMKADFERTRLLFYKFPDNLDVFEWETETPANSRFAGRYDLLFHYGTCGESRENRTTQGTIMLEEKDGLLLGQVAFDKRTHQASEALAFDSDFTLHQERKVKDEQSYDNKGHWEGKFLAKVIDDDKADMVHGDAEHAMATLKVLKNRVGCPWQPKEIMTNQLDKFDPSILVHFTMLEEAECLVSQYQEGLSNWFASPVLFFEPGDVVLYVEWDEDDLEPFRSYFVARKKTE